MYNDQFHEKILSNFQMEQEIKGQQLAFINAKKST